MPKAAAKSVGRPSTYDAAFCEIARKHCLLGATDAQLADLFDVSVQTLNTWKILHPEFLASIKKGKELADGNVADSLYNRALGYSHDAVKIFMPAGCTEPVYAPYIERYPPDTNAASLWLRNRQPGLWRDKTDVQHSGTITLEALIGESYAPKAALPGDDAKVIEQKK